MLRETSLKWNAPRICAFFVFSIEKSGKILGAKGSLWREGILRQTVLGDQTIFRRPWVGQIEFIRVLSNWSRKTLLNETRGDRALKGSRLKHEEF